ncbi:protein-L-isoaspartate O-methyltransferase family protein [Actinomadura opuntiae]|uniref:protein-L-isoaspartate O-methyltransferase family protein n=1 Tax=Actinomadura sp. OS1-43 TaxID=604315 RepID=UPI00255AE30D|nr:methyltransferase domain-containing protein [Actinomadura sp. OS1-43]MDL4818426.1 methyltransferase domain-containing protein [Actinomadura sp. OS1-43]
MWVLRDGRLRPLSREAEPEEWERLVGADEPIITKVKDGAWPMSSSTGPSMMAQMIAALRLGADMRVLEIGTGTGYNAACLAELGAEVVTVEVDPEVAAHAEEALRGAGCSDVVVIAGDGEDGAPAYAPFDRVVATAAAHTVPYAWIEQTKPGGLIVVPWAATFHPDGPLAVLTVGTDGTAEGRFTEPSWFMPLHGQRLPQAVLDETRERWKAAGEPQASRYGITVTPDGQDVWLDEPGAVIGWPPGF